MLTAQAQSLYNVVCYSQSVLLIHSLGCKVLSFSITHLDKLTISKPTGNFDLRRILAAWKVDVLV